jgi:hypothetical protein
VQGRLRGYLVEEPAHLVLVELRVPVPIAQPDRGAQLANPGRHDQHAIPDGERSIPAHVEDRFVQGPGAPQPAPTLRLA